MAGVWVFADQRDGKLRKVIFEMLTEGKKMAAFLGEELAAVVIGQNVEGLAGALAEGGAEKVIVLEDDQLANYTTDAYSNATTELIKANNPTVVLFANSSIGLDMAPVVAQKLNTGMVSDVTEINYDGQIVFKRPIYAGKAFASMVFADNARPMIATIRPKSFAAGEPQVGKSPNVVKATAGAFGDIRQIIKDVVRKASGRVELTEADVVISGGRGMKTADGFKKLDELADILNAAVGASRAAVDEGWTENQFQVGQTGKVVAPQLYIACGISGAIQHLAGISASKCIIAINKDPEEIGRAHV